VSLDVQFIWEEALKFHPCFEYPQNYRSNTIVIVTDVELANRVTKRIESHVPRIHTQMKKDWQFHGLNECFRFCRYAPAQKFEAHLDGAFTRAFDDKSYYTLMICLNDGFNGGSNCMALVFPHSIYHDGEPLQDNLK
jgi:prolyl 4-hydroxylase